MRCHESALSLLLAMKWYVVYTCSTLNFHCSERFSVSFYTVFFLGYAVLFQIVPNIALGQPAMPGGATAPALSFGAAVLSFEELVELTRASRGDRTLDEAIHTIIEDYCTAHGGYKALDPIVAEAKEHPKLQLHVQSLAGVVEEDWVFCDEEGDPLEDLACFISWLIPISGEKTIAATTKEGQQVHVASTAGVQTGPCCQSVSLLNVFKRFKEVHDWAVHSFIHSARPNLTLQHIISYN